MTTLKQKIEASCIRKGWIRGKELATCTEWKLPKSEQGTKVYVGVHGSMRIGTTRANSRPVPEAIKQRFISGEITTVA